MRYAIVVGLALGMVVALPTTAVAEDIATYEVEGEADAAGAEPRVAALDEAFGKAIAASLGDVLGAEARKTHKVVLDRELVAHARLWVKGFAVIKDATVDGRRQLTVAVRVDREKVRTKLGELDIGNTPEPGGRAGVILLRISDGATVRASYGATAEKDLPGLGAVVSNLRTAGVTFKRATATGPAARAIGDLPLDDDEAEALVADAKGELGVIAGVTIGTPVPVRGVATSATLVTVHIRVLGRGKKLIGQGTLAVASRGTEPAAINAAIERALLGAIADAMPASQAIDKPAAFTGDDTPLAEPGVVLLKIPVKTPYALVAAELKYLAGAKGVSRAALHRVSPGGWVIGVSTAETVQKVASIARKAPTADTSVQVKVVGDLVELAISGAR